MLRRTFLLSGAATALIMMAPNSAAALTPAPSQFDLPIRTLGVIERALDTVVDYGFTPKQRAHMFGMFGTTNWDGETLAQLRERVTDFVLLYDDTIPWNRARRIVAIRGMLDMQFPGNIEKQREAIDTPLGIAGWNTIREMMNTGSGIQLARAAITLGVPVKTHDLAEMKNFG